MSRPTLYTCSTTEFKEYILDFLVKENGTKRTVIELINNKEFQDLTGYYRKTALGRKSVAVGSIQYFIGVVFNLSERVVYEHHYYVSGKIPVGTTFDNWSKKRNKRKEISFTLDSYEETKRNKVITRIVRELKYPTVCERYTNYVAIWRGLLDDSHFRLDKNILYNRFKDYYAKVR